MTDEQYDLDRLCEYLPYVEGGGAAANKSMVHEKSTQFQFHSISVLDRLQVAFLFIVCIFFSLQWVETIHPGKLVQFLN